MPTEKRASKSVINRRIEEAKILLQSLGFPRAQSNERSALALLALLDLQPSMPWSTARAPLMGITPMMTFIKEYYHKTYAPNTRESFRRLTIHQFIQAVLVIQNPDDPTRATNSAKTVYQIEAHALELITSFGMTSWERNLAHYIIERDTLKAKYAQNREMTQIPVSLPDGREITLSPGGQNILIKQIVEEFATRFTPGGRILYIGDAGERIACADTQAISTLGIAINIHGKMPDVVIDYPEMKWIVLVEAVTSHGPIDPKRREELVQIFQAVREKLIFVTAFLNRKMLAQYDNQIAWETEVWIAESPTHLIHYDGIRFLGPYAD